NGPMNAYLNMVLLLKGGGRGGGAGSGGGSGSSTTTPKMPTSTFLYVALFSLQQFVCILAIHVFYTQFTKAIHRLGAMLMRISGCQARPTSPAHQHRNRNQPCHLRERLLLVSMVARLHTTRRYGIHYGPLGLVTVSAFVRSV